MASAALTCVDFLEKGKTPAFALLWTLGARSACELGRNPQCLPSCRDRRPQNLRLRAYFVLRLWRFVRSAAQRLLAAKEMRCRAVAVSSLRGFPFLPVSNSLMSCCVRKEDTPKMRAVSSTVANRESILTGLFIHFHLHVTSQHPDFQRKVRPANLGEASPDFLGRDKHSGGEELPPSSQRCGNPAEHAKRRRLLPASVPGRHDKVAHLVVRRRAPPQPPLRVEKEFLHRVFRVRHGIFSYLAGGRV